MIETRALDRRTSLPLPTEQLARIRATVQAHPLWRSRLLTTCERGYLTLDDYKLLFSQYYAYSSNFTRYLAALMTSCENDYFRSKLSQNLWEEGGALEPQQRHAELFRQFLRGGLGVEPSTIHFEGFARYFTEQYLAFCRTAPPSAASAFLALGTEGIVARLYGIFAAGLQHAGVNESELRFFHIHMECDDEHAATLEEMTLAYSAEPGWITTVETAVQLALDMRLQFFDAIYAEVERRRVAPILQRIQERVSLCSARPEPGALMLAAGGEGKPLYENRVPKLNLDFAVERVPFPAEVLDARLVRIKPGACNEKHKHAHETVFYVLSGEGVVRINDSSVRVGTGDMAFVPRWAMHQTENQSGQEMVLLAITDYGLTGRALVGNYNSTARRRQDIERDAPPST